MTSRYTSIKMPMMFIPSNSNVTGSFCSSPCILMHFLVILFVMYEINHCVFQKISYSVFGYLNKEKKAHFRFSGAGFLVFSV